MPLALTLIVYALAVARVTTFIVLDELIDEPRARLKRAIVGDRDPVPAWRVKALTLVGCPWCVSIYVGAVAAVVWYTVGNNPFVLVPAVALAFSQVTGMIAGVGRD